MVKKRFRIQDLFVDILVTTAIISAVLLDFDWLTYLIIGYTFFILFLKLMVLISEQLKAITSRSKSLVPDSYYHLLYGVNVLVLAVFGWYFTAVAWIGVWVISVYGSKK
jgi:hypothetical protein